MTTAERARARRYPLSRRLTGSSAQHQAPEDDENPLPPAALHQHAALFAHLHAAPAVAAKGLERATDLGGRGFVVPAEIERHAFAIEPGGEALLALAENENGGRNAAIGQLPAGGPSRRH